MILSHYFFFFFFFNDTAPTEIYTLPLHDALPISSRRNRITCEPMSSRSPSTSRWGSSRNTDRKSTRLNSSHSQISYAVFCLKKKKIKYLIEQQYRIVYCNLLILTRINMECCDTRR